MRITPDTNILVRAATFDDPLQARLAAKEITDADLVAITLPMLCEFCWVLGRSYGFTRADVAQSIRSLIASDNVVVDYITVEAGLAQLDAGGDFADGVIAHQGRVMGADTFVTFDQKAEAILQARGARVRRPG